jgi:hypothetical protein
MDKVVAAVRLHWKRLLILLGVPTLLDIFKEYFRGRLMDWVVLHLGPVGAWLLLNPWAFLTLATLTAIVYLSLGVIVHSGRKLSAIVDHRQRAISRPVASARWRIGFGVVNLLVIVAIGHGAYKYSELSAHAVSIVRFFSTDIIVLSNETTEPVYVAEFDVGFETPSASHELQTRIGVEIPPLGSYSHDLKEGNLFHLESLPSLGANWNTHYARAGALYRNCLEIVYALPSDATLGKARGFYEAHGEKFWSQNVIGILHYKPRHDVEIREERFAVTAVLMKRANCQVRLDSPPGPSGPIN